MSLYAFGSYIEVWPPFSPNSFAFFGFPWPHFLPAFSTALPAAGRFFHFPRC
jgi:hypothetical protein